MTKQGSSRYSKNGSLAVRWYYSESHPATAAQASHQAVQSLAPASGTLAAGADAVGDDFQVLRLTGKALPSPAQAGHVVPSSQHNTTGGSLSSHMKSICKAPQLDLVWSVSHRTFMRLVIGCLMLTGYFVLLASGF